LDNNKKKSNKIVIHEDNNIPVLRGECPKCHCGDKSLIIINFVKNPTNERLNMIKMKCVCCLKEYYKYATEISKNEIKKP